MNASGTFNFLRLFVNPSLCLPHATVSTFEQLPVPLNSLLQTSTTTTKTDIRAVVLDKDNCFAIPKHENVYPRYQDKFEQLRKAYPGSRLLIVSNSSGTGSDQGHVAADLLERNTGVKVLRHATKKPGCQDEVFQYFKNAPDSGVTAPSQIAIIGDRLFTDMLMANMMGAHGIWIKDGVVPDFGLVSHVDWYGLLAFADLRIAYEGGKRVGWFSPAKGVCSSFSSKRFRISQLDTWPGDDKNGQQTHFNRWHSTVEQDIRH